MSSDDILALLNRAASIRLIAQLRSIVQADLYSIDDSDILARVIHVGSATS